MPAREGFDDIHAADFLLLAKEHLEQNDLQRAEYFLERSMTCRPTLEAARRFAIVAQDRGDLDTALQRFHDAIQIDPACDESWIDVGKLLVELGRLREAVPYLESALRLPKRPGEHRARYVMGLAFEQLGDLTNAKEQFASSLRCDPGNSEAISALSRVRELLGE